MKHVLSLGLLVFIFSNPASAITGRCFPAGLQKSPDLSGEDLFRLESVARELLKETSGLDRRSPLMTIWMDEDVKNYADSPASVPSLYWFFESNQGGAAFRLAMKSQISNGVSFYCLEFLKSDRQSMLPWLWPFNIGIQDIAASDFPAIKLSKDQAKEILVERFPVFAIESMAILKGLPPLEFGALYFLATGKFCSGTPAEKKSFLLVHSQTGAVESASPIPTTCL